jgi:hypothetical protein
MAEVMETISDQAHLEVAYAGAAPARGQKSVSFAEQTQGTAPQVGCIHESSVLWPRFDLRQAPVRLVAASEPYPTVAGLVQVGTLRSRLPNTHAQASCSGAGMEAMESRRDAAEELVSGQNSKSSSASVGTDRGPKLAWLRARRDPLSWPGDG